MFIFGLIMWPILTVIRALANTRVDAAQPEVTNSYQMPVLNVPLGYRVDTTAYTG